MSGLIIYFCDIHGPQGPRITWGFMDPRLRTYVKDQWFLTFYARLTPKITTVLHGSRNHQHDLKKNP